MNSVLQQFVGQVLDYPPVVDAEVIDEHDNGGGVVKLTWVVSLPKKYEKAGRTTNGICDVEPVYFNVPARYPLYPPSISLRTDFPLDLPHIHPHLSGEPVPPCVSDVPMGELLHSRGLQGLLEATDEWLKNAASGELHDAAQGWEPVRRVDYDGFIILEIDRFRSYLQPNANPASYFQAMYNRLNDRLCVARILDKNYGPSNTALSKIKVGNQEPGGLIYTPTIVAAALEPNDKYVTEQVSTFAELLDFADHFGLKTVVRHRYKYIVEALVRRNHRHYQAIVDSFFVVLAIKRPYTLVGLESDIELLAYRVEVKLDKEGQLLKESPCIPLVIQELCNPAMLRAVTGSQSDDITHLTLIGCGSLGSKLALHLAKTGSYRFQLIDKSYMSMHNNARHGLIETNVLRQFHSKAELLEETIKELGIAVKGLNADVRALEPENDFGGRFHGGYIIDTTASLVVRHFLSHTPSRLPGRLIQSYLLDRSRLGVLIIEGADRNPRVDDINALLFQLGADQSRYGDSIYALDGPQAYNFGEGCGSYTTRMSDMEISLPATSMAAQCHTFLTSLHEDHESGQLYLSEVDDGSSIKVTHKSILPTQVFEVTEDDSWSVRLLGDVAQQINDQAHAYPGVENGGILLGQYDELSNTIYISGLMEAPPDSKRSATRFILGTQDVEMQLVSLARRTKGTIAFCGTWHSHPNDEPPSSLDRKTLNSLQAKTDLPVVMLVYRGGRIERILE